MITVVAIIVLFLDLKTAIWPLLMLTITYFVTSFWAWGCLISNSKRINFESTSNPPWSEAWIIVGSGALTAVLIMLERFTIPQFIDIQTLAIFAVLAAIAGSPFRVLQMGVGHTLIPRFRAANKIQERRALIFNEGKIVFMMIIFSSGVVWFLAPLIVTWFLDDNYILSHELVLAMIFSGSAKVIYSLVSSPIIAVGSRSDLFRLHLLSWATMIVAISGAYFGARWGGLTGLVIGVGIGWVFQSVVAIFIAAPHFTFSKTKVS
jgi:O-antigen/teichoic acid export membrane protein